MFKYLSNCLKLLKQYYSTPKGHHDILDYSRAFFLFIFLSIIFSLTKSFAEKVLNVNVYLEKGDGNLPPFSCFTRRSGRT